jgi:hypothetical protein
MEGGSTDIFEGTNRAYVCRDMKPQGTTRYRSNITIAISAKIEGPVLCSDCLYSPPHMSDSIRMIFFVSEEMKQWLNKQHA